MDELASVPLCGTSANLAAGCETRRFPPWTLGDGGGAPGGQAMPASARAWVAHFGDHRCTAAPGRRWPQSARLYISEDGAKSYARERFGLDLATRQVEQNGHDNL